jgi:hypothetical protein
MATINVDGAAARLLAQGTTEAPGRCLEHCWIAIGQGQHYIAGGSPSAAATAAAVPLANRHYDMNNIPKDFPIFLDRDVFISQGISNGVGTAVATDWPRAMQIGVLTVAQRLRQTGEHFQFWSDYMGGYDLVSTGTASIISTPLVPVVPLKPKEEEAMKLLYITDNSDGNGKPGWWLLNTRTGKIVLLVADAANAQTIANSWAVVWGDSIKCVRQDALNAQAAIQQTS